MTKEQYESVLGEVIRLKNDAPVIPREYWLKKKYDVLCVGDVKKLITKPVSVSFW